MPKPKINKDGYFSSPKTNIDFINSGCTLLNCVLGGGYPLGRIVNIVGDKSTGKSLLGIEACANFARQYSGPIYYREVESAWDDEYARALGLPLERVDFGPPIVAVEDVFEDLEALLQKVAKKQTNALYVLDSLDALSDRAELKRSMDEGSYAMEKAKRMGQLFRRLVQKIGGNNMCIIIISQVRDNIGVTFGRKTTRSGGRALDFYASQILYLAQLKTLKRTILKVERPIGVRIRAKCEKNKVALAYRECEFNIVFGYGTDSVTASLEWLESVGKLSRVGVAKGDVSNMARKVAELGAKERQEMYDLLDKTVTEEWYSIERRFLPIRGKYS
jgi:recombination protein RecA